MNKTKKFLQLFIKIIQIKMKTFNRLFCLEFESIERK